MLIFQDGRQASQPYLKSEIWSKFGENVEGAQIHIHTTRLEHSRSNRNIIRQLRNFFNFDLCDQVKSKTWKICDVVLLDTPPIKIW
jgi:hypothetical protein